MPGQATIVTEIYLPAKYAISPSFLQALDDSLLPKQVQQHFENYTEETIKKFLPEKLRERYAELEDGITKSGRSFGGYQSTISREHGKPLQIVKQYNHH